MLALHEERGRAGPVGGRRGKALEQGEQRAQAGHVLFTLTQRQHCQQLHSMHTPPDGGRGQQRGRKPEMSKAEGTAPSCTGVTATLPCGTSPEKLCLYPPILQACIQSKPTIIPNPVLRFI